MKTHAQLSGHVEELLCHLLIKRSKGAGGLIASLLYAGGVADECQPVGGFPFSPLGADGTEAVQGGSGQMNRTLERALPGKSALGLQQTQLAHICQAALGEDHRDHLIEQRTCMVMEPNLHVMAK